MGEMAHTTVIAGHPSVTIYITMSIRILTVVTRVVTRVETSTQVLKSSTHRYLVYLQYLQVYFIRVGVNCFVFNEIF